MFNFRMKMKKVLFFALAGAIAFSSCTNNKKTETTATDTDTTAVSETTKTTTVENLKAAIMGETNASVKYAEFAKKAREEGYKNVAVLFDAASKSEGIHAENHTKVLEGMGEKMDAFDPRYEVKTTLENLQEAIDGETHEFASMYPEYIATAQADRNDRAVKSFTWAADTEKKHSEFYKKALEAVKAKSDKNLAKEYYICPVCGNTYEDGNVEDDCSFCLTPKAKFMEVK